MDTISKVKRLNIVFNKDYLSCAGPWGLRVQSNLSKYYVYNNYIFLKKKRHYRQFINFINFFLKNVLNG